jgi:uncharacterized repeat protein (TIGR04138 family)
VELAFIGRCIDVARTRRPGAGHHVTAAELLPVAAEVAREIYGPEAPKILRSIGVDSSPTLGKLVFRLLDQGSLLKRDNDRLEDFDLRTSFDDLFV